MVGRPLGKGPQGGQKNKRFVAPDDDPNFLRDLQRKLKKDEDDQK
jgi:hypothetical protein